MNILYEMPWWIPGAIILFGAILYWTGQSSAEKRMKLAGIGLIALAGLLILASWLLESDREKIIRRTRELVAAVVKRDRAALESRLHPDVRVLGLTRRKDLIDLAVLTVENFNLQSASVTRIDARLRDDDYVVTVRIAGNLQGFPQMTDWVMEWQETADGWVMAAAAFEGGPGLSDQQVEGHLRRLRK